MLVSLSNFKVAKSDECGHIIWYWGPWGKQQLYIFRPAPILQDGAAEYIQQRMVGTVPAIYCSFSLLHVCGCVNECVCVCVCPYKGSGPQGYTRIQEGMT